MLALAHVLEKRTVNRKTFIISKGEDATEMYFVVRGEASVLEAPNDPAQEAVATISPSTEENPAWCAPFAYCVCLVTDSLTLSLLCNDTAISARKVF